MEFMIPWGVPEIQGPELFVWKKRSAAEYLYNNGHRNFPPAYSDEKQWYHKKRAVLIRHDSMKDVGLDQKDVSRFGRDGLILVFEKTVLPFPELKFCTEDIPYIKDLFRHLLFFIL